jgi:hypothetical protein
MLRMIEFYSGSGVMSEEFKKLGWKTLKIDLFYNADWKIDILTITKEDIIKKLGGEPNFMWFGTPCTAFSVASIGTHWGGGFRKYEPKTEMAIKCMNLAIKNKDIISWFPKSKFAIENPRGVLRKLPIYTDFKRYTITLCQYGDNRMKPTDIWTNLNWNPKNMCKNGDTCHVRSPRGSNTGTQGLKNAYERAVYPKKLCEEIALITTNEVLHGSR